MNQARLHCRAVSTGLLALCAAIFTVLPVSPQPVSAQNSGDEFLTVDCLLPGQVRKLGRKLIFLAPRRTVRTSQTDCEIRGGKYVSYDRASYGNVEAAGKVCEAIVAERLDHLNVESSDIREISYNPKRGSNRDGGGQVLRVLAWVSLKSCRGSLVIDMSPQCQVRQIYGRGECDLGGAVETW